MAEEQAGVPASEQSIEDRIASQFGVDASEPSPAPEGPEEASASAEDQESEQPEQQDEPAEDSGYEEVELDGDTYRVPPKLRDAVLRQKDYTQKTQHLAEFGRALQTREQMMAMQQQFQQYTADDFKQLNDLEVQLNQYRSVEWGDLDTATYIKAKAKMDEIKEQASEIKGRIEGKKQQFGQAFEQRIAQMRSQRAESLSRMVPGWNDQADLEATQAAIETGFSPQEILNAPHLFDARVGLLAWKAAQFDKLQQGKTAAVQQVKKAPPVIKPGAVNPMPTQVKQKLAYRKELSAAKSSQDKAKVIAKRLEGMFR